jgi:phosphoserine phosphatase RsbU/P
MGAQVFQLDPRWQQLRKLTEISRALTYATSLSEVLDLAVERAAELLSAEKAVLMLINDDGLLSIRASYGLDRALCQRFREPLQETLISRLRGLLGDVAKDHFLGVPLVVGGEVTGLLAVVREPDGNFDDEEWLLSALADQAAVALEKTRLDEAAKFRERLIGIVSHDLRNPISAISMAAELLLGGDSLTEPDQKTVMRIQRSATRATRLIGDLLDFTQARLGGGIRVAPRPANVHAIVRQVVDELELAHPDRQIEVAQHGDGDGHWDPERLAQVVGNLASNALQYGVPEAPVLFQTRQDEDGWITLTVHNQGAPIPTARLLQVFEPMQRGSESNRSGRSVGLGLYIVKHIVEAHGGQVSVTSSDGDGTTFTVGLPRQPAPA